MTLGVWNEGELNQHVCTGGSWNNETKRFECEHDTPNQPNDSRRSEQMPVEATCNKCNGLILAPGVSYGINPNAVCSCDVPVPNTQPKDQPVDELKTGYIKVSLNYAPKTNGKKFAAWCERNGFTPLGSGRRAWSSSLSTYLRDASGIAYADGEPFLFYEEDLVDIQAECNRARLTQTKRILNSLEDERREYGHLEGAIDIVENKLHIAELELQQLMKEGE